MCPAGLVGLNDIDHGVRQVWADTRHGIAGGEHERVHAETFALAPQPHKQHRPAYHAAHFDNNDLLLGTHAAIDFYEVDASAAVVSAAAAADATRWPLDDEMVEDDYLDDPPAIDAVAYVTWIRQRSHNIKRKQHLDLVVLGGLVLASYHLLDDALIDLVNMMHQFIDLSCMCSCVDFSLICCDVTMATTDATIAHIMDEQEDIKIKSSKCWNPIRPPTTLLTSNGRRICIRPPFLAREYLMESSWSPLSNGSSLIAKFHLIEPQLKQQGAVSPIMGLWACNFVWDPGPCGVRPNRVEHDPRVPLGIRLICTGKINNPRRGVSIAKAQHNVSYGCSRIVNGIPEAKGVGVRQVTSKVLEQEHHCHACPARMDATLVCLPQCLLVTHFPDGKPQSLHAVLRKAFMAFAGLDQGEVINHEAEDVHHDFFPLQDHPALNSPCNPHPLGGHYCRARTTCLAGLFGLNDIDHGGRQVWADTRYGIAGGEHERVHAETFALVPQPHKQHIPAYHATHFDNNDLLLGTHAAIDVYEADAAAAVVSAAAADATRWPLDDEMVEDDYLDDPPIIDAAATSTAPERHGDGRAPPADVKGEGDVDSSISFRDRRDCHDRHNCCMFAPFIPSFPESPFSQEKSLKSSKANKASHTDPKQPFEHVDPV
ncbi:hypothetical protein [Oryza sativa Japonica Group]|uniref:Uncharacterized protein n=2 Tax=Oryza TaxID=4527 RepID=Q656S5_ORYSJ|nr:hypothetical protein [Oryza sativa Japonica Group]BAD45185.1 hypothetical protein [Oryza sativa Japonica Group]